MLRGDLGPRPNYHQLEERVDARNPAKSTVVVPGKKQPETLQCLAKSDRRQSATYDFRCETWAMSPLHSIRQSPRIQEKQQYYE